MEPALVRLPLLLLMPPVNDDGPVVAVMAPADNVPEEGVGVNGE